MATYKVLQDIEAEDKLLGPLTLKQFVFAIIAIGFSVIAFFMAQVNIILGVPWLIPILFFGFMAAPIGRDQPNDVWLAARIRFFLQPRVRVWNQSGLIELVTITAPKRIERVLTNNLSQHEVRSRLGALASTLDSRGWAVKNVNVNLTAAESIATEASSDRLISLASLPQEVPTVETDVTAADDIMDPMSNMVAQRFENQLKVEQQKHLETLRNQAKSGHIETTQPTDYSFITDPQPAPVATVGYATFGSQVVAPHSEVEDDDGFLDSKSQTLTPEEQAALDQIHKNKDDRPTHLHEKVVLPVAEQKKLAEERKAAQVAQLPHKDQAPDATIHELSTLSDTSVASLASLAEHAEQKAAQQNDNSFKEGQEISLH